jgi:nucleotide-binding universal stress UspA family protein
MFDKILVPLGDSEHTSQALKNACETATYFNSQVHGLYITDQDVIRGSAHAQTQMPPTPMIGGNVAIRESPVGQAQREIVIEEDAALQYFQDYKVQYPEYLTILEKTSGIMWEEIIRREHDYDLVSLGRTVYKGEAQKSKVGDIVKQVAYKSTVPVMVSTSTYPIGQRLMVCYDGKKNSHKALGIATGLAKKFGQPLLILTIEDDIQKAEVISKEAVNIAVEDGASDVVPIIHKKHTVETILSEVDRRNINLLIMGAYGDGTLKEFFAGSTTEDVINQTGCAVILYR